MASFVAGVIFLMSGVFKRGREVVCQGVRVMLSRIMPLRYRDSCYWSCWVL